MSMDSNAINTPSKLPTRAEPLSNTANSEMEEREVWNKKNLQEMIVVRDLKNYPLVPREYRNTKAAFFRLGHGVRLEPHLSELPPGARSVNHRHTTEAVIYIVSGEGYSIVGWEDDELERIDWREGDMFSFPAWMWHQHFNASETEVTRYLAVQDTFHLKAVGLHAIERHPNRQ